MDFVIDIMKSSDWEQVAAIYREGIETGIATFQQEPPSWESWDKGHLSSCRLVARYAEHILGWAALSPFSSREVYRGVADVSIYVSAKHRGQGVGKVLLNALVAESEKIGLWTLQSRIIRENTSSIALHKKCGFREVGIKEKLGRMEKTGIWHDIVLMERRSKVVGVD